MPSAETIQVAHVASSADVAARLERMPISTWHIKIRLVIGIATFFDAFNALAIAYILPVIIPLWRLSPGQVGLAISSGYLGQLVGAFLFGWIAERYGRKPAIIWSIVLYAVFGIASAGAGSFHALLVLRVIQGIGLGGEVPVAIAYISEFARAEGRGRFVLLYEMVFPLGLLAAAFLGMWVVPHLGWRVMLLIGGLPALVVLAAGNIFPESPRWLASRKRFTEAEAALQFIEAQVVRATGQPLPPPQAVLDAQAESPATFSDLFGPRYLRRTLVVWVCWFATYLVTYGLVTWLPTVYRTVFHLSLVDALRYSLVTSFVGLFFSLSCALWLDKVGRRRWFSIAFAVAALALLLLWFIGPTTAMRVLMFGTIASGCAGMMSVGLYVYTPELYPTRVRAIGVGTATAWLRLAAIIGPSFVGAMIAGSGLGRVFLGFGVVAALAALVVAVFAVETRRRILEQISP